MDAELHYLNGLLVFAMVVAPFVTSRFFLASTRLHDIAHAIAAPLAAAGTLLEFPGRTFAWLAFCVFSFGLFLRERFAHLRSSTELAKCVPFAFSIIGATWLVSGANDFGLLGYGKHFSYYAALHSHILGWMLVGSIAALAATTGRFARIHLAAVFTCLASFLLIAFGIDGIPVIKPIGVAGITLATFTSLALFLAEARKNSLAAFALGLTSLLSLAFTMLLAWQNELGIPPEATFGARGMVSLHGLINAVLVAPTFAFAVHLHCRTTSSKP